MINVYAATANDYSTNGLIVLDPWCTSASIREKLNGEYTLTLELEINARTVEVVNEMVIKVPAPVRFTPQLDIFTPSANEIWKVNTNTKRLSLRTKPSTTSGRVLHAYKKGTEVVVTDKSNPQWYVVAAPDGRSGYMEVRWLAYVRDEFEAPAVSGVIEEHKTKEQLFRVRSISSTLDRITIEAQHISYDLRRNYIKSVSTKGMRGAEAFPAMMAATISGHEFNAYSDIAETVTEDIKRKNPIEALFSDGGLISTAGGEVLRDNFDIYWVQHIGQDRGVSIAYRKNMSGMDVKIDTNGLVTRIIPVGYNKNNEPIYGDAVDSVHINEYAQPYILEYEYKDVKIGNGYKDAAAVKEEVQRLAALEYDKGIDLPTVSASVGYVDLQNTNVGKTLQAFTGVFLGDTVRIRHEDYRFDIATQINAYEWDVLLNEYVGIDLGSKQASMSDVRISPSQIGNSTLAGRKLAVGTVSGAELGEGSVSSEHITDDAVENRHISANSIEADQIAAKSITAEKIAADAITSDKIAAGAIEAGKIAAGAITSEKINAGAITTKHIAAGTVTAESGIIANGAIGTAQIADGSITSAKVVDLSADVIKTGTLSAERLLLVGDDGVIYKINAASSGLSLTELSKEQYKHYINGTVIVAKSITAAQIAAQTITANEILAGTITAKEINISDLFASQATINALNAMDIRGNTYLKLMVDSVQVGGTNLVSLQDGKLAYVNSTRREWENKGYCRSGYGFVMYGAQNSPTGYCSVEFQSDIELYPGKYMLSFWSWCAGVNVQPTVVCNLLDGNAGIDMNVAEYAPGIGTLKHYEIPVTVAQTMHAMLRFITWTQLAAGEIYISDVKLEKGSRATDWSPYPEEFRAGSNVLITTDEVKISTPEFNVDIVGDDGETNMLSIDENGAQMRSLTAPDVTPRYAGPATIYVNPAATSAQIASGGYYRSLADALGALSNRHLDADVTVSLAAGMTEYGTLKLSGTAGPGKITIMGRLVSPAKIVGGIYMYFVNARVMMQYVNIDTTAIALQAEGCMYVNASNCVFTGPGVTVTNTMAVRASLGAMVSVTNCEMYDCYRSVYGHMGGQVSATNCKGNCRAAANNSVVYISGTASCDLDSWTAGEYAGKVFTSSVTVDHGTATVPEIAPITTEAAATATDSYTTAWRQADDIIRQGYYSGAGEWAGCMWFPTMSFAGKTVKTASLTLTRTAGTGRSGEVTLTLYGITVASASGNPHAGEVYYGVIGKINNGETKTFTLPLSAAQALANGTIKGFMLYANDGGTMSGRDYSYNYCKIDSSGGTAPKLSVTY